jgi:hypothetical protein
MSLNMGHMRGGQLGGVVGALHPEAVHITM